jgi:ABC-2 type transport system permease protein
MPTSYSQVRAMLAITKASLLATFKSPQAIFFGLFFPIVLIVIFGSLGRGGTASVDVAVERGTDTTTILYQYLSHNPVLHFVEKEKKDVDVEDELRKGRITAVIGVTNRAGAAGPFVLNLRTSSASQKDLPILQSVLRDVIHNIDQRVFPDRQSSAVITQSMVPGRKYKMIDFFLPGMIGFSLIGSAVFGVAFLFFSLRETLVLKRLYSTPIRKNYIILGEGISKVIFQLATVVVLILFGRFAYGFTLAHGWVTFANMLFLSFLALLVFIGFGFFFSSLAKNQNVIPIYVNLFMFPQYFLSGTFFPRSGLPESIQPLIKYLPLTALNDSMRNVAFEGASLASCWQQILILLVWGIAVYAVTIKVFRWE